AVAVVNVKLALPLASVVTLVRRPRKNCPSLMPAGLGTALEKSSTVKVVLGMLLSVPAIIVTPAAFWAEDRIGKFCKSFGPMCGPPGVLGLTPSSPRSIPSLPLPNMGLPSMATWVLVTELTVPPLPLLLAIRLPAALAVPPMVLIPLMKMPSPLGR